MGYIAVDLDGTLAYYEFGQFPEIGDPIPAMLERVQGWLEEGKEVKICTARAAHGEHEIARVREWLEKHGLGHLEVNNRKDPDMDELWDDKAIQVKPNTGQPLVDENFQKKLAEELQLPKSKRDRIFGLFKDLEKSYE